MLSAVPRTVASGAGAITLPPSDGQHWGGVVTDQSADLVHDHSDPLAHQESPEDLLNDEEKRALAEDRRRIHDTMYPCWGDPS